MAMTATPAIKAVHGVRDNKMHRNIKVSTQNSVIHIDVACANHSLISQLHCNAVFKLIPNIMEWHNTFTDVQCMVVWATMGSQLPSRVPLHNFNGLHIPSNARSSHRN